MESLTSALTASLYRPRIHLGYSMCQAITTTAAQQKLTFTASFVAGPVLSLVWVFTPSLLTTACSGN